jgi:hypothetical protein
MLVHTHIHPNRAAAHARVCMYVRACVCVGGGWVPTHNGTYQCQHRLELHLEQCFKVPFLGKGASVDACVRVRVGGQYRA